MSGRAGGAGCAQAGCDGKVRTALGGLQLDAVTQQPAQGHMGTPGLVLIALQPLGDLVTVLPAGRAIGELLTAQADIRRNL
jgi:hypothetical protein